MTPGSAGFDLFSAVDIEVPPSCSRPDGCVDIGRALVPTGIVIEVPPASVGRIGSRSGLSVKSNIETGAGWIDSDYRGEVQVELKNFSSVPCRIGVGDRIAQLVLLPLLPAEIQQVTNLEETSRGSGGFGSTGR